MTGLKPIQLVDRTKLAPPPLKKKTYKIKNRMETVDYITKIYTTPFVEQQRTWHRTICFTTSQLVVFAIIDTWQSKPCPRRLPEFQILQKESRKESQGYTTNKLISKGVFDNTTITSTITLAVNSVSGLVPQTHAHDVPSGKYTLTWKGNSFGVHRSPYLFLLVNLSRENS